MVFNTELDLSDAKRELEDVTLELQANRDLVDSYEDAIPERPKRSERRQPKRDKTRALKEISNVTRRTLTAEQSSKGWAIMLKLMRLKEEIFDLRSRKEKFKQHVTHMRAAKRKLRYRTEPHHMFSRSTFLRLSKL
ncbi:hypothetical protein OC861_006395 [Tilletia horrida]|nr:hypothetical protein OC861_006395 [Tilletia horrida]